MCWATSTTRSRPPPPRSSTAQQVRRSAPAGSTSPTAATGNGCGVWRHASPKRATLQPHLPRAQGTHRSHLRQPRPGRKNRPRPRHHRRRRHGRTDPLHGLISWFAIGRFAKVLVRRRLLQPVPNPKKRIDHDAHAQESQQHDDRRTHVLDVLRTRDCWRTSDRRREPGSEPALISRQGGASQTETRGIGGDRRGDGHAAVHGHTATACRYPVTRGGHAPVDDGAGNP